MRDLFPTHFDKIELCKICGNLSHAGLDQPSQRFMLADVLISMSFAYCCLLRYALFIVLWVGEQKVCSVSDALCRHPPSQRYYTCAAQAVYTAHATKTVQAHSITNLGRSWAA